MIHAKPQLMLANSDGEQGQSSVAVNGVAAEVIVVSWALPEQSVLPAPAQTLIFTRVYC
jgi:hypothetical protein